MTSGPRSKHLREPARTRRATSRVLSRTASRRTAALRVPTRQSATAASLAPQPARARLVRVLRRRRADRLRAVRLGLSDDAEVDPGRYRPGAVDRQHRRPDRPDAGRADRRRGALASGWSPGLRSSRSPRARSPMRCCPIFPVVFSAATLHAAASCVLGPCIVALSLGLVGYAGIGDAARPQRALRLDRQRHRGRRDGRDRLFLLRAGGVLRHRRAADPDAVRAQPHPAARDQRATRAWRRPERQGRDIATDLRGLLRQRPLFILAGCVALFHLANASMLPLMGSVLTTRSGEWATVLIAACIVVPQGVVALISPWVGRQAEIWGRRGFLIAAFAALVAARHPVCDGHRSARAGGRPVARRHHGRVARRHGAADDRRHLARHRPFQFRARHRRHRGRDRRLDQPDARRLSQRPVRQPGRLPRARRHRGRAASPPWRRSCRRPDRRAASERRLQGV